MVVLGGIMTYARVRQLEMKNSTPDNTGNNIIEIKPNNSTGGMEDPLQKVV